MNWESQNALLVGQDPRHVDGDHPLNITGGCSNLSGDLRDRVGCDVVATPDNGGNDLSLERRHGTSIVTTHVPAPRRPQAAAARRPLVRASDDGRRPSRQTLRSTRCDRAPRSSCKAGLVGGKVSRRFEAPWRANFSCNLHAPCRDCAEIEVQTGHFLASAVRRPTHPWKGVSARQIGEIQPEEEGFEPTEPLRVRRFSKPVPCDRSATPPSTHRSYHFSPSRLRSLDPGKGLLPICCPFLVSPTTRGGHRSPRSSRASPPRRRARSVRSPACAGGPRASAPSAPRRLP